MNNDLFTIYYYLIQTKSLNYYCFSQSLTRLFAIDVSSGVLVIGPHGLGLAESPLCRNADFFLDGKK